jgi:hypothetical protein
VGSNPQGVAVNLRTNAVYVANQWPVVLAWGLWALTLLALPVVNWLDQRLRQAGLRSWPSWNPPPSRWSRRH